MLTSSDKITALAEPIAAEFGLEVLDIQLTGSSGRRLLRVFLDKAGDESGVSIEECARVSRRLGDVIDAHEAVDGRYMLEVSSAGLNRPLRKIQHFQQVLGERVKLRIRKAADGQRNFVGILEAAEEDRIALVDDDGARHELELVNLDRANLEYRFDEPGAKRR